MLFTKIEPQSFFGSGENTLPYMGMAAILFNGVEPFEQIVKTPSAEGPMWNLAEIGQAVSDNNLFKDYTILYRQIGHRQRQITTRGNFDCS